MSLLKKIGVMTVVGVLAVSSVAASAATVVRVGHGANEAYHMHRAMLRFKEVVQEKSGGRFDVQIFPSSQMGPDREMIESVQSGVLQMAVSPASFYSNWDNSFDTIELPFIYPSKDVALKTVSGPAGDAMLKRLGKINLVGLGWLENGVRNVTNNRREIRTPDDLNGVKLRTMKVPAHMDTFNALGASATPMNFGEVYSALQQGVIDGQENPIALIHSQRFYEVQKFMSLTGHVFTFYIPVVSQDFWHTLSSEDQELFLEAMSQAQAYQQELVNAEDSKQLAEIEKAGVKVTKLSPSEIGKFKSLTESVRQKYRKSIPSGVYDDWMKAIDNAS
ncbi:MAG: TRAP transporter substrate-binding protein [Halopseudomonas sp.]